jgi:chromosome segregation protein
VFLRSLTARGFKSFADKITLEFTPGVSVIVGPNGSGKSNIVDAIAWVLGEQGPRALRGTAMADVIFAGSPGRPALGMAEVKLVIDNSAGLIPVPASEIEISRSLYRSGDSEYRIGGRPCRLLDIHELLSDTGMGRAQHTIIGQGQLDAVLSARPDERRQFVEEAAGIAKHRRRRDRAERKLAGLEHDVLRLQDVINELRRQLKPLKHQAELAERHETLTREAESLARKLAAARLAELYAERDRRRPSWEAAEARQAHTRERLAELDNRIAELDGERVLSEATLRRAETLHQQTTTAKSEAETRLRAGMREEAVVRERLGAAVGGSGRLFALEEELERTKRAADEAAAALADREAELELAETAFRAAQVSRQEAEEDRRRFEHEAMARRAETEAHRRALTGHEAELTRLEASVAESDGRIEQAIARSSELEAEVERLDARSTPLAADLSRLDREVAALATDVSDLDTREKGLLARQDVLQARQKDLSESPGASFIRKRGERPIGLLHELIEAAPDLRMAVRAALGSFSDAVVYATQQEAIAEADAEGATGLTLAVASATAPPRRAAVPVRGERELLSFVRPHPRVADLVARLLADVYLVNNVSEATSKHGVHPEAHFVTPQGVVIGPAFVRTPPGHDRRVEELQRDLGALERDLAATHRGVREGRQRLAEVTARADAVRTELEEADRGITRAADQMGALEREIAGLRRERQLVADRAATVEAAAAAARLTLTDLPPPAAELPALPPMAEPPVHVRVEVEALRRERARLDAGASRIRKEIEALAADDPIVLRDLLKAAENERALAEEALRNAGGNLSGALVAFRATSEVARRVQSQHDEANRAWREHSAAAERLRMEHEEEDRARLDLERRVGDGERMLRNGHQVEPSEAVASLDEEETVQELQRRADVVARRLGLVGRVNLLAVDELDSLKERHDFLLRELEDVRAARRDLLEVIQQIDERVAGMFDEAFQDVAREFSALFELMFPGGEGRLTLEDPADLLGSGIEVEARPGRGRVKRLSLLSGGERSLAALAFLFAIFRARPSPFYLMDEVEAALDDVNLNRFLQVVREFARSSQILIVTHQKRTMETADVLYGVSMGRDGASTVISQRLASADAEQLEPAGR